MPATFYSAVNGNTDTTISPESLRFYFSLSIYACVSFFYADYFNNLVANSAQLETGAIMQNVLFLFDTRKRFFIHSFNICTHWRRPIGSKTRIQDEVILNASLQLFCVGKIFCLTFFSLVIFIFHFPCSQFQFEHLREHLCLSILYSISHNIENSFTSSIFLLLLGNPFLIYSLCNQAEVVAHYKIIAWFIKMKRWNWWKKCMNSMAAFVEDKFVQRWRIYPLE